MPGNNGRGGTHRGGKGGGGFPLWAWLLIIILILAGFLAAWFFWFHWFGWGLSPCDQGCCADFNPSFDPEFGVDTDGNGINTSYYIGGAEYFLGDINLDLYNLIISQDFASDAELMAYLNAHYPDQAYLSYVQFGLLYVGDARGLVDASYSNYSLDGTGVHVCEPAVLLLTAMDFTVFYENGTEYGTYTVDLVDFSNFTSIVDAVANSQYIATCGGTLSVEINSLVTNPGAGDPTVTITINGVEHEVPVI